MGTAFETIKKRLPDPVGDDSAVMIPSPLVCGEPHRDRIAFFLGAIARVNMSELDEAWAAVLAEAEQRARSAGRNELAEYLSLRNSNDLLRKAGVDWLLSSFTALAGEANRVGASIQISHTDAHRFRTGMSTMVGNLLTLTNGVRTLYIEAGWPRTPHDGVVRGGGLACGNIRHLGIKALSEELLLMKLGTGIPSWSVAKDYGPRTTLHESHLRRHLAILLDVKN
jgi:hypothetical protein